MDRTANSRPLSQQKCRSIGSIDTSVEIMAAKATKPRAAHAGTRSKEVAARKIDATPNRPFAFVFKSFVSLPRSRRREDQGSARCQRSVFTMPKNVQALRCVQKRVGSRAIRKPSEHSLKPS